MRIVIVDDEPAIRFALEELLRDHGFEVLTFDGARAALAHLQDHDADLVISDLTMPGMGGLELLEALRAAWPEVMVILMTAYGDERTAVRALKLGAWDYVPKPFENEEILATVERVREVLALRRSNQEMREELAHDFRGLVGSSAGMRDVASMVRRVARTDATVLIAGESGTGKELVARAIHDESPRSRSPFVALNCSALPPHLVESELFGHVKGAFTGAERDRKGLFEAAEGGTLFLDEVGEMAMSAQAKLLRALEQREVLPVGATRPVAVDVRIVAATNRDLHTLAKEKAFREDLLYRLRVVTIEVPPLRERTPDIIPLAVHFVTVFARRDGDRLLRLSDAARAALLRHPWPGNVRELRNAIERATIVATDDLLDVADLPAEIRGDRGGFRAVDAALSNVPYALARDRAVDQFSREMLSAALERHHYNISETARALGLHRQSLQKMMRRLGIAQP